MDYIPRAQLERPFRRLTPHSLQDRLHALHALAKARGMRYRDDSGRSRTIDITLKPWVLTSAQLWLFHRVILQLADALVRVMHLHRRLASVREVIPFDSHRQEWLSLCALPKQPILGVVGRLDSTALYDQPSWKNEFRMLEPNAVGVGGLHYAPTCCSVVMDVVGDLLVEALPGRPISPLPDPRALLIQELEAMAVRLGHPLKAVALIENTDYKTGTDEFQQIARTLSKRGLKAIVADPRELRWSQGKLMAKETAVDFLYRDSELAEFLEMEQAGFRLSALRQAIREGRLLSSLAWEFDQKSAWEIFTDKNFSRYFTPSQRQLFREHLLWTRLVRDAWVSDPKGKRVALVDYIRRHKDSLVLKPNLLFGGEGVVLGIKVSQKTWEKHLEKALKGSERYVVQQLACIATDTFPLLKNGQVRFEKRCAVSGFFFNSRSIGLIGRFSPKPVVNVSQGGGLVPALWVH
ncbi:MAG: hypothetical protein HYT88_04385 [Candidatus Omnitrophica bacterium]|nr:hypothetical protein [Candidatus Omnitrophota bacterium]MBI2174526.1 hypothetical protein [Candidatus Omnitrophota bacterium]